MGQCDCVASASGGRFRQTVRTNKDNLDGHGQWLMAQVLVAICQVASPTFGTLAHWHSTVDTGSMMDDSGSAAGKIGCDKARCCRENTRMKRVFTLLVSHERWLAVSCLQD